MSALDGPTKKNCVSSKLQIATQDAVFFDVPNTFPAGPVIITPNTKLTIEPCAAEATGLRSPSYEEVWGRYRP